MITVATLFAFLLLALACVSGFGLWLGLIIWLIAYAVFRGFCRAVVRHVDPD